MPIAVQRDRVTRRDDLGRERRPPLHLLADHEERGVRSLPREHLEDGGRALRVRPVVESHGHARSPAEHTREIQGARRGRNHGRECMADHGGNDRSVLPVINA